MLWAIFVIVLLMWLLGFSFHIAGDFIHILLVIALISLIFNLIRGRSSR
ncbi:lmo0937 family membrane protein [Paenibacillus psychroresistens]|uniref:Lmo0937 family membrane protein n=1 Tax=Paenibacillus psychroresistens TaxID=1778678 RepID=A0A6B8RMW9_9BACL|nr:lmo0937 family membrane protein [Paenibacillus psychroresistens]QGQ97042.1 lmo0937 family membrane protein [Paenibacillus psychroresistens]